jgi:hypothetical protein
LPKQATHVASSSFQQQAAHHVGIVGLLLVVAGGWTVHRLVVSGAYPGVRSTGPSLLALSAVVLGLVLGLSPAVRAHLQYRRSERPEAAGAFLAAAWIAVLAVLAVWAWVAAGVQVL